MAVRIGIMCGMSAASRHKTPEPAPPAATPVASGAPPVWRQDDGLPVSCLEKIKVLNENYAELRQVAQDAFEDALLIGCSEAQVRQVLHGLIDAMVNPYPGKAPEAAAEPPKP